MTIRGNWRPLATRLGYLGLALLAFGWGRYMSLSEVMAAPQVAKPGAGPAPAPASSDYDRRWVAVINGNVPITREEFGEYLIARHGDQLELFVNKRIIEYACKQRGIEVSPAEVEAAFAKDLKGMNVNAKDFEEKILQKHYHKTLLEWKEDVIRPKLSLSKMCQDRVHVTDQDLKDAFDAYYGEKVDCRLVLFPSERDALAQYADLRKSDEDFDRVATHQANPQLAAVGGRIRQIAHHTTGNDDLEKEAFRLQPGEVSKVIGTPDGFAVLKCNKRIPPDDKKKLADVRATLEQEIIEKKTQIEVAKVFKELKDQAQPKLFNQKHTTEDDLIRDVKQELQGLTPSDAHAPVAAPASKAPMK
jgi:hypothetical protein